MSSVDRVERTLEEHVDALEKVLVLHALDGEESLVAEQVRAHLDEEGVDEGLKAVDVDLTLELEAEGGDGRVVFVIAVGIEELWIHGNDAVKRKGLDVEELARINLRLRRADDGRLVVDALDLLLDVLEGRLLDQVDLVEENAVGEGHLFDRLVLDAFGLHFV